MSYGKLFASTFTGSMYGAGPETFAVWSYVIAHTIDGQVELNPAALANIIGTSRDVIDTAIDNLCDEDPNSRNSAEQGRRLIKEGQFAYRVVSHSIYRGMRDEDDRRSYNRQKQRESRERRKKANVNDVNDVNDSQSCQPPSAQAEAEAEAEAEKETPPVTPKGGQKRERFVAPSLDAVQLAGAKAGLPPTECEKFWSYYEANGWRVGRNPMKAWERALSGWKLRWLESGGPNGAHQKNHKPNRNTGTTNEGQGQKYIDAGF